MTNIGCLLKLRKSLFWCNESKTSLLGILYYCMAKFKKESIANSSACFLKISLDGEKFSPQFLNVSVKSSPKVRSYFWLLLHASSYNIKIGCRLLVQCTPACTWHIQNIWSYLHSLDTTILSYHQFKNSATLITPLLLKIYFNLVIYVRMIACGNC